MVGTVTIGKTGGVEKYRSFGGKVKNAAGVHDLYICFDKASGDVQYDDFKVYVSKLPLEDYGQR